LKFVPMPLAGAFIIEIEPLEDERGFLARLWCREQFAANGIDVQIVQASVSHNAKAGTVRGMHLQLPPSREAKIVRCVHGRIHDVIIDLRPASPTFMKHLAITLDSERRNALYIPPGMAHGFQTLTADTDVSYMMSDYYKPELQAGVRWNDPAFAIAWPLRVTSIITRDREYPDFDAAAYVARYDAALEGASA
jgi:dTDP-4-dehydrorhamnose 3,5-epimerase